MHCKNCAYFEKTTNKRNGFVVGYCLAEPLDITTITNNHSMAVQNFHDGNIIAGEMFGCVNFNALKVLVCTEKKPIKTAQGIINFIQHPLRNQALVPACWSYDTFTGDYSLIPVNPKQR